MDQPRRELGVHGAHREKPVSDRAERIPQPVAVREAGQADRRQLRFGLDLLDERGYRVPERRLERRARPALSLDPGEVVVTRAEDIADLRFSLGLRLARQ